MNSIDRAIACFEEQYPGEREAIAHELLLLDVTKRVGHRDDLKKCFQNPEAWDEYHIYNRIRQEFGKQFENKSVLIIQQYPMHKAFVGNALDVQGCLVETIFEDYTENDRERFNRLTETIPYEKTHWDISLKTLEGDTWEDLRATGKLANRDAVIVDLLSTVSYLNSFMSLDERYETGAWDEYCEFIRMIRDENEDDTLFFIEDPHEELYRQETAYFKESFNRPMTDLEKGNLLRSERERLFTKYRTRNRNWHLFEVYGRDIH